MYVVGKLREYLYINVLSQIIMDNGHQGGIPLLPR